MMLSPANDPHELLTNAQMSEADRLTIARGTSGIDLMERAGAAIADTVRQMLDRTGGRRVAILCGPGNNGGDGFVAARLLRQMGFSVSVGLLGTMASLKGDAALAAKAWTGRTGSAALVGLDDADLAIDALFGAGLARDIDGRARAIVERLNAWRVTMAKPVVAVDVPSGIDGDTGSVRGIAVEADVTVTFFRLKPGHLLLPGRIRCGRIVLADIGIASGVLDDIRPQTFVNTPGLWRASLPLPQVEGHKYSRGHTLVVSGPAHQTGAARMSANAALRAGSGLVTVA
ncbi:MAG: NAD(P)H-hydrate epimerase, partial [Hyphomicrobiales bacterium]|nr:NAD(P)H-hydrate epimerase [Hyphomicrobiales bacterium]